MTNLSRAAAKAALEFYIDHGVDVTLQEEPANRMLEPKNVGMLEEPQSPPTQNSNIPTFQPSNLPIIGKAEATQEAIKLAQNANSLEELKQAIADFDGISLKKTATNLVFADGNPKADIMLIGEAPGADEDRQGKPFVGVSGQLLDTILSYINIARTDEAPEKSIYISNILNWRPPGNRTPSPAEIEVSLPFIERHIQLIAPKLIIFCGGVAAKSLLGSGDSISRLRKKWHDYTPQTQELGQGASPVPAIATYHPAYLLRTPAQKKAVWADMIEIRKKLDS